MKSKWTEASDEHQIPFMLAARKVFNGEPVRCPKCDFVAIRYYFHIMNQQQRRGTIWAWCPKCFIKCHLPRVSPRNVAQVDPFANLTLQQFAELEVDPTEPFMERMNRLWEEGKLG
jgi:hypothetical protein